MIGAACFAIGLAGYHLMLLVSDATFMSRGSYLYYLLIGDVVRNFPVLEPIDEPEYFWSGGFDNRPREEAVFFCSTASHERVTSFYTAHVAKLGFTFDHRTDTVVRFVKGRQSIVLGFQPELGCLRIHLGLYD